MKSPRLGGWGKLTLAFAFLWATPADAQEEGYQLNRLTLSPAGDAFTLVEYPWYSGPILAAEFNSDYGYNVVVGADGEAIIGHSQYGRLGLTTAFMDSIGLSLSLPFVLFESGTESGGIGPAGTVMSDPRLGLRARLWGAPDSALSISTSANAWLPIGAEDDLAGDAGLRLLGRLTAGGLAAGGKVRWGVNAGYLHRDAAQLSLQLSPVGNAVGSEVQFAAGASYLDPSGRFRFGPEATLGIAVDSSIPDGQSRSSLEAFLTGRYAVNQDIEIGAGLGTSVSGAGAPEARGMLTLTYSYRRRPTFASSFEQIVLVPDEDGHVGVLEIDDGKNKTVLDTPYASTELSKKDKGIRKVQSSARAVEARTSAVASVLPPLDRDADEVADKDDACPDRKGVASPDPLRNGCPEASEKIVVLPDEDGHVGAIEVDDGNKVVLVDKPFAAAEISATGEATKVAPAPAKVAEKALEIIALELPPADRDGDGIFDKVDACPDRVGQSSADALRNGCPPAAEKVVVLPDADGHVGAIEVDDGKTKTVVDKPYASLEVANDGSAALVPPMASPKVLEKAIADVAAVLPIADSDGDGIADGDDSCPARSGKASPDPLRHGCPPTSEKVVVLPDADGHIGALEVDDGKTKTVLDTAFASTEVDQHGAASKVAAAPPRAVLRSLGEIADTLPKPDLDGDGIIDANDACKDRKGPSNANPQRHGCPPSAEKIVLLADEDGHVGSLEIGEGPNKVVLDTAYASIDVDTDGGTRKVEGDVREIEANFAEVYSVAKQAKKARAKGSGHVHFTVYFDDRANPTRDIDEQIEALLFELQGRDDYRIEVVGHTDATGSQRINLRVGRSRAAAIAERLKARGIPANRVMSSSRGSGEPAVEVIDPKVPEPLNRRVEIRVKGADDPHVIAHFSSATKTQRDMREEYRALVKLLRGQADYTVLVVGHTDSSEDEGLAKKRADSVARRLRGMGISGRRIEVSSKGASVPAVDPKAGGDQQQLNRRVEIFVKLR